MSVAATTDEPQPWPARDAPSDELLERAHRLWKELVRRGEVLSPSWVEEAARDLKSGELPGLWLPGAPDAPGLAVYSVRGQRVYAHVHVDEGARRAERVRLLVHALTGLFPKEVRRADVGLSGLPLEEEEAIGRRLISELGGLMVLRCALERRIGPTDREGSPIPFEGGRSVPIRAAAIDELSQLDWTAFQGTPDEQLVADTVEEDRRTLGELLDGRLGRFLDEASEALASSDGRLVAAILVSEQDPHHAMACDLVVDPAWRRRGIARALLLRSFRALVALGYDRVRLWVTDANRPARSLYDALGFYPVSTAWIYRWSPNSRVLAPQPQKER